MCTRILYINFVGSASSLRFNRLQSCGRKIINHIIYKIYIKRLERLIVLKRVCVIHNICLYYIQYIEENNTLSLLIKFRRFNKMSASVYKL